MSESDSSAPVMQVIVIPRQYLNFTSFTSCTNLSNFLLGVSSYLNKSKKKISIPGKRKILRILF